MPILKKDMVNYLKHFKVSDLKQLSTYFNIGGGYNKDELISKLVDGSHNFHESISSFLESHTSICSSKIPSGDDVLIIPQFLSVSEIEELKLACPDKKMEISKLSQNFTVDDTERKSYSCYLDENNSAIVQKIKNTIHSILPENKQIEIQILKYDIGGYYAPHYDDFNDVLYEDNRKFTFFIILENDCSGGETEFPNLGIDLKPDKGSAIFWNCFNSDHTRNINKLHGGKTVMSGKKMACNIWVR